VDHSLPNCYIFTDVGEVVVANAVFLLSIAWSVSEIFAIKVYCCPKSSTLSITDQPLYLGWWNLARTCTSAICRTLLNFKVIGQRSHFFRRAWCGDCPRTVLSIEQGLVILLVLLLLITWNDQNGPRRCPKWPQRKQKWPKRPKSKMAYGDVKNVIIDDFV